MQTDIDDNRLISTSLPTDAQIRIIFAVIVLLIISLIVTAPYARVTTVGSEVYLPAYAAAVFGVEAMTAAILFATFNVQRLAALLILAGGYFFSAILAVPWALTFPGVFPALELDENLQATAWIAAIRRIGFAFFVIGYALAPRDLRFRASVRWVVFGSITIIVTFIIAALWVILGRSEALPAFMLDTRNTAEAWRYVPTLALFLYAAGIAALLVRRRSTLDIWMSVVLFSLFVEILLVSYMGGGVRLSIGWWSGRFFGLVAASIVLLVLLSETTGIYARLAQAVANERRARQNRLTAMEALSAAIAHEINQPLASMVTNAGAGLRWLSQPSPRLDQAEAAFERIVADGHRANKIVSGIRTMFMKGAQERVPLNLVALINETLSKSRSERATAGIEIELDCPVGPISVIANAVQLHQVISNLVDNAMDALKDNSNRTRRLTIAVREHEVGEIEASFADTGAGLSADTEDKIFLPFFSTKPDGMGMGLMFCRSVIEAHGGRLWATANQPRGAVFHFTLPASILEDLEGRVR